MLDRTNYTMLFDFYELTMANGYYVSGKKDEIAYFDVFFRDIPTAEASRSPQDSTRSSNISKI